MMTAHDDIQELQLDAGPKVRRGASERTCIVTRRAGTPEGLMRFVVGPDEAVVPDLKARLPGRGAWVTPTRAALDEAIRRNLFARAFKRPVAAMPGLADLVDHLLESQALDALSLANKAGTVVTGFAKVDAAIASGHLAGLVHASDAGDDGVRKMAQAVRRSRDDGEDRLPRVALFTSTQLDLALGRMNVVHAALLAGGPSSHFLARCTALEVFRTGSMTGGAPPAAVNEPKH